MPDLVKIWSYLKRGHSIIAFFFSIANFITIQYYFVASKIWFLSNMRFHQFIIVALVVVLPIEILLGYLDYKKFSARTDTLLMAKASPFNKDLAKALIYIAEGKPEKAIKTLEKWI